MVVTFHKGLYKAKMIRQDMTKVLMAGKEADFECKALQNLHKATAEKLFWCLKSRIAETSENARRAEVVEKSQKEHDERCAQDPEQGVKALLKTFKGTEAASDCQEKRTGAACESKIMELTKDVEVIETKTRDCCELSMKCVADSKIIICDASESIENGWSSDEWDRLSISLD